MVTFVWKARPEILDISSQAEAAGKFSIKNVLAGLGIAAVITGGALSWFASSSPDGLEWSMFRVSGSEELETPRDGIHHVLASLQEKTSIRNNFV